MGRLDHDAILQHFSHQHTLKLMKFNPETSPDDVICAACRLLAFGWMYTCSSCNYYLHQACAEIPRTKKHQIDPDHTLNLLPFPAYSQGAFRCNACGDLGDGFCFHCQDCELDLHILCAHMPSSVNTNSHDHALQLCFSPPYNKKAFECDICKGSGSNHWLYHCQSCEFDAHLNCAVADVRPNQTHQQQSAVADVQSNQARQQHHCAVSDVQSNQGHQQQLDAATDIQSNQKHQQQQQRAVANVQSNQEHHHQQQLQQRAVPYIQGKQQPQQQLQQQNIFVNHPLSPSTMTYSTRTLNPTVHRFAASSSSAAIVTPQIQIWGPNPNHVGYYRSQSVGQMSYYYMPSGIPVPLSQNQYVVHQPPKSNSSIENKLMGLMMKGVVNGVAQQAGQILLGSILGGFSFS